jgi:hypothetical protein
MSTHCSTPLLGEVTVAMAMAARLQVREPHGINAKQITMTPVRGVPTIIAALITPPCGARVPLAPRYVLNYIERKCSNSIFLF